MPGAGGALAPSGPPPPALGADALVNDRSGDALCAGCGFRPLTQSETTIAALGNNLLAGWNDSKGFCSPTEAVQGYAWSVDGGVTWSDGGSVPALLSGGRYHGDPVHAVNRKTGDFYILGLYEGGMSGSGLALARGHFAGGSFVFDDNRQIAVGGTSFLDKEWFAVDSLTGNLYVSWTDFPNAGGDDIVFVRSTDNGLSWSAPVVLNSAAGSGNVQGSRPVVGPDGELYVVWYEYGFPLSHMRIRRSDDFGVSFGPERTVCDFYENVLSGAPGYRRTFAPTLPSIAVDASPGPLRGRVYVAWDEAVDFYDAPFTLTSFAPEAESNDFFLAATPFTVGEVIRGRITSGSDVDLFRFSGLRGQTVFFAGDSAGVNVTMRLVCESDTSTFNEYRSLALTSGSFPAFPFTLPRDGTYYLRITGSAVGNYRIPTTFDTPTAGERARDHRDRFAAYSDDGALWSTPARLNDDDPWFDGIFPELTVDGTGAVHCYWHDFRNDVACAAESYEYMTSSGDGGVTWGANRPVSDAQSFWSANACGSANQGDYQGITSQGTTVYPCWSDSRLGDPDVFVDASGFRIATTCPPSAGVSGGSDVVLAFQVDNPGNVEGSYVWEISDQTGWLTGAAPAISGSIILAAGGSQVVQATFEPSGDCFPALTDTVRFVARDLLIPGREVVCTTVLTCVATTAVPRASAAVLAFAPPRPNPATGDVRFGFSLPRAGRAGLVIYGAGGARVRTLVDGAHEVVWDGRDERGRRVAPGVYFAGLRTEAGEMRRTVTLVR